MIRQPASRLSSLPRPPRPCDRPPSRSFAHHRSSPKIMKMPGHTNSSTRKEYNYAGDERANVVKRLDPGDVLYGMTVRHIDWYGNGVVRLAVRQFRMDHDFAFPRALPGEKLALRVDDARKRHWKDYDISLIGTTQRSEDEVEIPCPHFLQNCGGCAFQHYRYDKQIEQKTTLLKELFRDYNMPYIEDVPTGKRKKGLYVEGETNQALLIDAPPAHSQQHITGGEWAALPEGDRPLQIGAPSSGENALLEMGSGGGEVTEVGGGAVYSGKVERRPLSGGRRRDVTPCLLHTFIRSPKPFRFRNKLDFAFQHRNVPMIGLFHRQAPSVLPIDECLLAPSAIQETYEVCKEAFRELLANDGMTIYSLRTGLGILKNLTLRYATNLDGKTEILVNVVTGSPVDAERLLPLVDLLSAKVPQVVGVVANVSRTRWGEVHTEGVLGQGQYGRDEQLLYGRNYILQRVMGQQVFRITGSSFFHTNMLLVDRLCEVVLEMADPSPDDVVWDAYCGSGMLGILFTKRCRHVVGVDWAPQNMKECRENMKLNNVPPNKMRLVLANLSNRFTLRQLALHVRRWAIEQVDPDVIESINERVRNAWLAGTKTSRVIERNEMGPSPFLNLPPPQPQPADTDTPSSDTDADLPPSPPPRLEWDTPSDPQYHVEMQLKALKLLAKEEEDEVMRAQREAAMRVLNISDPLVGPDLTDFDAHTTEGLRKDKKPKLTPNVYLADSEGASRYLAEADVAISERKEEDELVPATGTSDDRLLEAPDDESADDSVEAVASEADDELFEDESEGDIEEEGDDSSEVTMGRREEEDAVGQPRRGGHYTIPPPDILVLDPPKDGCHKVFRRWLRSLVVKKVVYVSNSPRRAIRDAQHLILMGYQIERVQPIDIYPHTTHFQIVMLLTLRDPPAPVHQPGQGPIRQAGSSQETAEERLTDGRGEGAEGRLEIAASLGLPIANPLTTQSIPVKRGENVRPPTTARMYKGIRRKYRRKGGLTLASDEAPRTRHKVS